MTTAKKKKRPVKGKKQDKIQKLGSPILRTQPISSTSTRNDNDREKLVNSQAWKAYVNRAFFLFRLMHKNDAAAIAANQLNFSFPAWVWEPEGKFEIILDPIIRAQSEEMVTTPEGCLSLPGQMIDVERHRSIVLEGYDHFGEPIEPRLLVGWDARVAQHEYEHLCGGLIIDHLSDEDKCAYLDKERRGLGFV